MALLTNLKTYREKYNLKQADLAELVGVRRETIVTVSYTHLDVYKRQAQWWSIQRLPSSTM